MSERRFAIRKVVKIEIIAEQYADAKELFEEAIFGQRGTLTIGGSHHDGYSFDVEFDGAPDPDEYGV